MNQPVTILYFASVRERIGLSQESLPLPEGIVTVHHLLDHLAARSPAHAAALQNTRALRFAVNQEFTNAAQPVRPGDEIAFFPPMTGG